MTKTRLELYKERMKNTKEIRIYAKGDEVETFQKMYPQCMSRFIRNAIALAIRNKDIFTDIFFSNGGKNERII